MLIAIWWGGFVMGAISGGIAVALAAVAAWVWALWWDHKPAASPGLDADGYPEERTSESERLAHVGDDFGPRDEPVPKKILSEPLCAGCGRTEARHRAGGGCPEFRPMTRGRNESAR